MLAELDELRAQNDNLRERLEASEHQREQSEQAFRDSAHREHILAAGQPCQGHRQAAVARQGLNVGYLAEDGRWIGGHERDAERVARKDVAKRAMREAHRSDRPIEAAAGDGRDPTHRAAREFAALTHSVDPDEISPKDISAVLEHGRKAAGHDDDPATASAYNAAAIGELAEDTDDNVETIDARSHEDEHDDYEDDYEDSDADRFAWLEDTYDLTADQLAETLHELDAEDAQAAVDAFEELYTLHLQGYGREAAEQLYLAQLNSDDTDSAEDANAESYADDGDAEES